MLSEVSLLSSLSSHHLAPDAQPAAQLGSVPPVDSQTGLLTGTADSNATHLPPVFLSTPPLRLEDKSYPLLI